jgi:queuosine precursor transporter
LQDLEAPFSCQIPRSYALNPLFLRPNARVGAGILAMTVVVLTSNILVQFPLGDWLTWGAFTYPFAFLVNDLTNRHLGAARARIVVVVGFVAALVLSALLATPRLAIASGSAFLIAQLIDIAIFDRLRAGTWWRAPFISSFVSSLVDTALFFSLAFAGAFVMLGAAGGFATAPLAILDGAPRWVGWAAGDLVVKLALVPLLLVPYRFIVALTTRRTLALPA